MGTDDAPITLRFIPPAPTARWREGPVTRGLVRLRRRVPLSAGTGRAGRTNSANGHICHQAQPCGRPHQREPVWKRLWTDPRTRADPCRRPPRPAGPSGKAIHCLTTICAPSQPRPPRMSWRGAYTCTAVECRTAASEGAAAADDSRARAPLTRGRRSGACGRGCLPEAGRPALPVPLRSINAGVPAVRHFRSDTPARRQGGVR
jgi:hypothetical protein